MELGWDFHSQQQSTSLYAIRAQCIYPVRLFRKIFQDVLFPVINLLALGVYLYFQFVGDSGSAQRPITLSPTPAPERMESVVDLVGEDLVDLLLEPQIRNQNDSKSFFKLILRG